MSILYGLVCYTCVLKLYKDFVFSPNYLLPFISIRANLAWLHCFSGLSLASFEDGNSTDWCLWFSIESVKLFIGHLLWWKHDFAICLGISFPFNCSSLLTSSTKDGDLWMPLASTEHGNKVVMHKSPPCHWYDMCFLFPVLENEVLLNFFTGLAQLIGEIPLWSAVLNAPHWGFSRPPIGA